MFCVCCERNRRRPRPPPHQRRLRIWGPCHQQPWAVLLRSGREAPSAWLEPNWPQTATTVTALDPRAPLHCCTNHEHTWNGDGFRPGAKGLLAWLRVDGSVGGVFGDALVPLTKATRWVLWAGSGKEGGPCMDKIIDSPDPLGKHVASFLRKGRTATHR